MQSVYSLLFAVGYFDKAAHHCFLPHTTKLPGRTEKKKKCTTGWEKTTLLSKKALGPVTGESRDDGLWFM